MISFPRLIWFLSLIVNTALWADFNPELFEERKKSMVFVEYYIQMEVDRQAGEGVALVANDDGLIVCLGDTFPTWIPPKRFRDIEIFTPNNVAKEGFAAEYLGQDYVNGWHYLQITDLEALEFLTPITDFPTDEPAVGEKLWGFGMTNKEMDYFPYFQDGRLSAVQNLPLPTAFTTVEIAVPGGPVFDFEGDFVGWSQPSFPLDRDIWIRGEYFQANLRNPDESFMFLLASPFIEGLGKNIPSTPIDGTRGWLGVVGSQPLDADTSEFLGLQDQGAVVVSEVLDGSPADLAGLEDRDIILGINGESFPRFRPNQIVLSFFEREMNQKIEGETIELSVLRGEERLSLEATLTKGPKKLKATDITYFEELGFSIREFLFGDAVARREDPNKRTGIIASFVRSNSPAASAELRSGDWVVEINGQSIPDTDAAISVLSQAISSDFEELILLVKRRNETAVVRIQSESP